MTATSTLTALAAALIAFVLLWGPGLLVVHLVRMRGLLAWAIAPSLSLAIMGGGAIVTQWFGLSWGYTAAVIAVGLAIAGALGVRQIAPIGPPGVRISRRLWVALGIASAILLAPVVIAVSDLDTPLQRWDALFHLSALRQITDTGSASSLTVGSLAYGDGRAAIYPAAWHAVAALLPGSGPAALTIATTVGVLPWILGSAALAQQLWPRTSVPPAVAAVLAGLATTGPLSMAIGWGHVPNAVALAMLPALLALGLRLARHTGGRRIGIAVALLAMAGLALTHPNAGLAAALLLLPALAIAVVERSRTLRSEGRTLAATVLIILTVLIVGGGAAGFVLSGVASSVTGYAGGPAPAALVAAAGDLLSGWFPLWPGAATVVVTAPAVVGAAILARRGNPHGAILLGVAWLLYLDAATGGRIGLAAFWYTSPIRLSVVVVAVAIPLSAGLFALILTRLPARVWLGAAAAVVVAMTVVTVPVQADRVRSVYQTEPGHPPQFVTSGELDMIAELPRHVGSATVLGSPFSGAATAYGLTEIDVVFPVAGQVWSADQQLIMENLQELTTDADVCAALRRLGVGYLYQDDVPYQHDPRYDPLDTLVVPGAQLVVEADSARLMRLPACSD